MPITIKGIRIVNLWIGREEDTGKDKITSSYQLISSTDKVLAKESLSTSKGYNENTFTPSLQTLKMLSDAVTAYRRDVEMSLGLDTSE